ncbi:MAG: cation-translocating P-type ATPase [Candidatus Pacebacteria bacterium]|nr:cation-translocating P-type ATPase [Candidatus Paceibacterota bacterium]
MGYSSAQSIAMVNNNQLGLTSAEAQKTLLAEGPNQTDPKKTNKLWRIVKEVMAEPMFQLMLAAGIRLVMITGDHRLTALAMARQAGISAADVYARVTPIKKLELIQKFKSEGQVVAMTGDGVNDAPALKAAHIGIAMGKRGTDVAREAAALVLMEDSFADIVAAIRAGRLITQNIKQALSYSFSLHLPIIILSLVPVLMNQPMILLPLHIVFFELIFNPISSLVFEAEPADRNLMRQPPVPITEELLTARSLMKAMGFGLAMGVGILILYLVLLRQGTATPEIRAAVITAMVGANLGAIFIFRRQWFLNRLPLTGWLAIGLTLGGLSLIVNLSFLADIFALGHLSMLSFGITLFGSLVLVALGRLLVRYR